MQNDLLSLSIHMEVLLDQRNRKVRLECVLSKQIKMIKVILLPDNNMDNQIYRNNLQAIQCLTALRHCLHLRLFSCRENLNSYSIK